ncbi:uncharacterized protein [Anas platyrhynchos]|uniref:uncharacterized protein n=1 Tax=Anas platyrhynchos TaxID=8839 RepID=UPI003AF2F927
MPEPGAAARSQPAPCDELRRVSQAPHAPSLGTSAVARGAVHPSVCPSSRAVPACHSEEKKRNAEKNPKLLIFGGDVPSAASASSSQRFPVVVRGDAEGAGGGIGAGFVHPTAAFPPRSLQSICAASPEPRAEAPHPTSPSRTGQGWQQGEVSAWLRRPGGVSAPFSTCIPNLGEGAPAREPPAPKRITEPVFPEDFWQVGILLAAVDKTPAAWEISPLRPQDAAAGAGVWGRCREEPVLDPAAAFQPASWEKAELKLPGNPHPGCPRRAPRDLAGFRSLSQTGDALAAPRFCWAPLARPRARSCRAPRRLLPCRAWIWDVGGGLGCAPCLVPLLGQPPKLPTCPCCCSMWAF